MLSACEDTPNLARLSYPSAALLGVIRENLAILDQVTRVGPTAFCGSYGHPQEYVNANPFREAWGSFRVVPGATTLTTVVRVGALPDAASAPGPNDRLRVRINGAEVATYALVSGLTTYTTALPSLPAWHTAEVIWEIYDTTASGSRQWPRIDIEDAYISPIPPPTAWPGVPTFGGSLDPAALAQLADAVDWLITYAGRRTEPLFQSVVRWWGTSFTGQPAIRWQGGLTTGPTATTLRADGFVWLGRNQGAGERIRLLVNDVEVASYTVPAGGPVQSWSLGATVDAGVHVGVRVEYIRDSAPPGGGGGDPGNYWSLRRVGCQDSGTPPITLPATIPARTATTWATLRSALNAASTATAAIKARMDAAPAVWARQRLFRRRYAYDAYGETVFEPVFAAWSSGRQGEALLLRGSPGSIQWGPGRWLDTRNEIGAEQWELQRQQSAMSGDALQTELVYLDTLDGLPGGVPFAVRAQNLAYAGEIWRVGGDV